jgi:uncharacterized coiled-coil protein SlyX/DNA-directed RNA polymerase subunit RPC12/RpoP
MSENAFKLQCPSCGANLTVKESIQVFACGYCGSSIKVKNADGVVTLQQIGKALTHVEHNTGKVAAELAIVRLSREIAQLEGDVESITSKMDQMEESGRPPANFRPGRLRSAQIDDWIVAALVGGAVAILIYIALEILIPRDWAPYASLMIGAIFASGHYGNIHRRMRRSRIENDELSATIKARRWESVRGQLAELWNERDDLQIKLAGLKEELKNQREHVGP